MLKANLDRRLWCFCSCSIANKVRMCSWKHQEPFWAALGTNRPLIKQAMALLRALSLASLWTPTLPVPDWESQFPAQTGQLPPGDAMDLSRAIPCHRPSPASPAGSTPGMLSSPGHTRHGLPLSPAPPGTSPEPHIYLMLMPRCLDIHHVLSWESN